MPSTYAHHHEADDENWFPDGYGGLFLMNAYNKVRDADFDREAKLESVFDPVAGVVNNSGSFPALDDAPNDAVHDA